jgi:hypothetical protein
VGLLSFAWDHEFKVLNDGPFPAILGMDFLNRTQMRVDIPAGTFSFAFAPEKEWRFSPGDDGTGSEPFLQQLCTEATAMISLAKLCPEKLSYEALMAEFQRLFSTSLGTASVSHTTLRKLILDQLDHPYRCAPPKAQIFKRVVNELLQQRVVRPSKSQYAGPAFLVPKTDGSFRLVVDYRKVNSKICLIPTPYPQ